MTDNSSFKKAIIDTLKSPESKEIAISVGDIIINGITDSEIIDIVPILKYFKKGHDLVIGIRDKIFVEHIYIFISTLQELNSDNEKLVQKFNYKIEKEPLLLKAIIKRLSLTDDFLKAKIIGYLMNLLLIDEIMTEDFLKCSRIIDYLDVKDFLVFIAKYIHYHSSDPISTKYKNLYEHYYNEVHDLDMLNVYINVGLLKFDFNKINESLERFNGLFPHDGVIKTKLGNLISQKFELEFICELFHLHTGKKL